MRTTACLRNDNPTSLPYFRRGVRSSRSARATDTPAASSAWQTTCFMVSPLPFAASVSAATVDVRTRKLSVVGASSVDGATWAGGCWGAVLAAIARASSGEGRRDLSGAFISLRPYVVT
jgi:hypothetical protein